MNQTALLAFDAFVKGCKADGIWDLILDCGFFCGVNTLNGALIKLKTPTGVSRTLVNTNFVSGDYTATGASAGILRGGSSGKLLTSAYSLATIDPTDFHIGIYSQANFAGDVWMIGSANFGYRHGFRQVVNNTQFYAGADVSTNGALWSSTNITGLLIGSRTGNTHEIFKNGSLVASNAPLGANTAGATTLRIPQSNNPSSNHFSFYTCGLGITNGQAALYSVRINALHTAFAANKY